jgi:hypothetical protein
MSLYLTSSYYSFCQICHKTGNKKCPWMDLEVAPNAVAAHLNHGDEYGTCESMCADCDEWDKASCQCIFVPCPPTFAPSGHPSTEPSDSPSYSFKPTRGPTETPSLQPSQKPSCRDSKVSKCGPITGSPSLEPTASINWPTGKPFTPQPTYGGRTPAPTSGSTGPPTVID